MEVSGDCERRRASGSLSVKRSECIRSGMEGPGCAEDRSLDVSSSSSRGFFVDGTGGSENRMSDWTGLLNCWRARLKLQRLPSSVSGSTPNFTAMR